MADICDPQTRSHIMRQVKAKGNKSTELRLIRLLREVGITGWRRNYSVKGHPDFVFIDKKIAVFADGCFWHGHDCRNIRPEGNKEYWAKKRERNAKNDKEVTSRFEKRGWTVVRIWECELKKINQPTLIKRLKKIFLIE